RARNHTGNVPNRLGAHRTRRFVPARMASASEHPVPFAAEVRRRNFREWHLYELGMEVSHLLTVAFDGLRRQFLLDMLGNNLRQQRRERLGGAATTLAPALASSRFWCSCICRATSASAASFFVANPEPETRLRSCRVAPARLNS